MVLLKLLLYYRGIIYINELLILLIMPTDKFYWVVLLKNMSSSSITCKDLSWNETVQLRYVGNKMYREGKAIS